MIIRILNWLTGMHWSISPHGMGCTHQKCPTWERCRVLGSCADFPNSLGRQDEAVSDEPRLHRGSVKACVAYTNLQGEP